jgi:hypothetical protein
MMQDSTLQDDRDLEECFSKEAKKRKRNKIQAQKLSNKAAKSTNKFLCRLAFLCHFAFHISQCNDNHHP